MRVEHLSLLLRRELVHKRARAYERVGLAREPLDEARSPLEQLRELFCAQLPR
jgi:hypothetical protein